jgi:hypothetical protein
LLLITNITKILKTISMKNYIELIKKNNYHKNNKKIKRSKSKKFPLNKLNNSRNLNLTYKAQQEEAED